MEKFGLFRNEQEIGQFSTIANRGEEGFLDEFYAILMTLVPDAGDENLKDKTWSHLDQDFDFNIDKNHYAVRHYETI